MTDFWKEYWKNKTHGGHRLQSEEFLCKEAREKLFHLQKGKLLLDFACGSGDLLVYYTDSFEKIVGVDFSPTMLENARRRVKVFGCSDQVTLIQGDDLDIWSKVPEIFSRITAGQVVQYLNPSKLENFIHQASERIEEDGKIVLFDVIDPRIYYLYELGLFAKVMPATSRLIIRSVLLSVLKTIRKLKRLPASELGYSYLPAEIGAMASRSGLNMEITWSMYYEYRYHVILTK